MHWSQRINYMIGMPVCVSLNDGSWAAGVLCEARDGLVYVLECINQNQFTTNSYQYYRIKDVSTYPSCNPMSGIMPPIMPPIMPY